MTNSPHGRGQVLVLIPFARSDHCAGQNASEHGTRNAVLNSRLGDFAGYRLALDCGTQECGGERVYSIDDLARVHGAAVLMGRAIVRLRCRLCGRAPVVCYIETRPQLAARGRMRRLSLVGPEAPGDGR